MFMKGFGLVWAIGFTAVVVWNHSGVRAQSVPTHEATLGEQNRSLQSTANKYDPYRFLDSVKNPATQQQIQGLSKESGVDEQLLMDIGASLILTQKAIEAANGDFEKAMELIEKYFKGEWQP